MELLVALFVGLIAGVLADMVVQGDRLGLLGDIAVGVLGGFIGGIVFQLLGIEVNGFIGSIITAFVGALILLALVHALYVSAK
jgi:uncharacterized membrane protein YeaQ/YmgE (transglycosylase-associated protein family)